MSRGYSVAQTARLVCALRWTCSRLSEILEAWAGQAATASEHAGAAVGMSQLSRLLTSHRETLDGLQPDSELMASWRQAAPADLSLAAALEEIAALEGSLERLGVARKVFVPQLLGVYGQICAHAAPHCDAALASAARSLGQDLDCDHHDGSPSPDGVLGRRAVDETERVLSAVDETERVLSAVGETERVLSAVGETERVLSAVGGIVGPSVLQPDGWP